MKTGFWENGGLDIFAKLCKNFAQMKEKIVEIYYNNVVINLKQISETTCTKKLCKITQKLQIK